MKTLAALIITLHCYSDQLTIDVCASTHLGWCQGSHTAHSFGSFCFLSYFIFSLPPYKISILRALATWSLSIKENQDTASLQKMKCLLRMGIIWSNVDASDDLTSELTTLILFDSQQNLCEAEFLS